MVFFDVRMRGFRDRAEVTDVQALLAARCSPLSAEVCSLLAAAGRVLAEAVIAPIDVPGFDRAAMDGYALHGEDTFGAGPYNPLALQIVGESLPGRAFVGSITSGQAIRIMTGAPLPLGADAVLPAEQAEETTGTLRVCDAVAPGRHVGKRGEDIAAGRTVLAPGRVLRPQDVGLLASLGIATVMVIRRPRVAILVTGDEILPTGTPPTGYRIADSNSPMLAALACRDGADVLPVRLLPDRRETIREALAETTAEVILITGGTSVGQEDHAPRIVAELGELAVHGVALRPAAPTGVGFIGGRLVGLVPGNPVSCLCAYDVILGAAVRQLGGRSATCPYRTVTASLTRKLVSAIGRVDYARVRLTVEGVEPLEVSGAARLSSTVQADGFVLVERDREGHAPGEVVIVHCYD